MNHGLKLDWRAKLKRKDPRNFSRKKKFGAFLDVSQIPDFDLDPNPIIKNQLDSYMCTAFSNTSVSEVQEGVELSPEYAYQKTNVLMGVKHSQGADYFKALKVHCKFGCIEQKDAPFTLADKGQFFVENSDNWDTSYDTQALVHKKKSYLICDQGNDAFDSALIAMYQSYQTFKNTLNKSDLRAVSHAMYWMPEFQYMQHGMIPESSTWNIKLGSGHNVKLKGKKTIDGVQFIVVQNSYGEGVGDGGMYYFPRQTFNACHFESATFEDVSSDEEKNSQWSLMARLWDKMWNLLKSLSQSLGIWKR